MATDNLPEALIAQARQIARATCASSAGFATLTAPEQRSVYLDEVRKNTDGLARAQGLSTALAKDPGAEMGFGGYDPGFSGSTKAFGELVDSVDFPKFTADLLKAVFDANISVMRAQTDDYIRLMKEATKSSAEFIKNVKDEESFSYLAENNSDQFNLGMETDADGSEKLTLTDPKGEKLDPDDAIVKGKIMDAKVQMAREHRAALREVILMGVTRLVVEKGEVEAGVEFKITAKRDSKTSHKDTNINTVGLEGSYGGGPWSVKASIQNTNIQVNTSNKSANDDLSALLKGKVRIQFKTDYFKLDNFANMYGDGGVAALKSGGASGNGAGGAGPTK